MFDRKFERSTVNSDYCPGTAKRRNSKDEKVKLAKTKTRKLEDEDETVRVRKTKTRKLEDEDETVRG